jgi:hypothetical protein
MNLVLPADDELVPPGVAAVGGWVATSSHPTGFDPTSRHENPEALGESFAAAADAAWAGPTRPRWTLDEVNRQSDGRVAVIVSELGAGDDSVAGTQYAIVARSSDGTWGLDIIFARPMCRRAVADGICL